MLGRFKRYHVFIRQYGLKRCLFRLAHDLRRRAGLLKRKFPAFSWEERPLSYWLDQGVPSDPGEYRAFRERSGVRFFFPPGQAPQPRGQWLASAADQADELIAGRMRYFSRLTAQFSHPEADWLTNPFTGQRASAETHWSRHEAFDPARGDIKFYWEPSRFCWAYALVRAYAGTGQDKYAEAFWRLLESWTASNPPNMGPNWQCGQEISIRILACIFALYGFWRSPATTDSRVASLVAMLAGSAQRAAGNINYARAQMGNHATSEAAGLYTVGTLLPELKDAARWRKLGRWVLEDEARHFNWPDGSYVQHSTNYHRVMLHAYLWCMRLAELNGEYFSPLLRDRLDSSYRFLQQLQDPASGRCPNYGPNDGALILPLNGCDYLDYRPSIGAMHFLFTGERLYEDGPWSEDLLWLFGPEALTGPARSMPRTSKDFDDGGYYTLRGKRSWAMVRCHSYRSRPNQSDMLHLDLWWNGVNVLRDSGTFRYFDPADRWNLYFVSTAAHNTVLVGGVDQMVKGPRFRWYTLLRSRLIRHIIDGDAELWQGEHYGYRRLPCRAIHRRTVCRFADAHWLVIDDVLGSGTDRAQLFWHLPDLPYERDGNAVRLRCDAGEAVLRLWAGPSPAALRVERGLDADERMGWQSLYYGERTPTPSVCMSHDGALPVRFVTLLSLGEPCVVDQCEPSEAISWSDEAGAELVRVELDPPVAGGQVVRAVKIGGQEGLRT